MFTIYVYVLDTLADWGIGRRYFGAGIWSVFKRIARRISLKTVKLIPCMPIHTAMAYNCPTA